MADEAAIIWLKVLKQNDDWGNNEGVYWILTYTSTQLGVQHKIIVTCVVSSKLLDF